MNVEIYADAHQLGCAAGTSAGEELRKVLAVQERARIIVATGASQFETLGQLIKEPDIDWARVDGFHLDEYLGLSVDHPASFCRYLRERFVSKVPIASFFYLDGMRPGQEVLHQATAAYNAAPIDVALIGIGENGHLAFNDPPADFHTDAIYHIVALDHACRMQQVGEGWFKNLDEVPTHAISMTVPAIMRAKRIICSVPDERKAVAVEGALTGDIAPAKPASILRTHPNVTIMLDNASASRLEMANRSC
ncbi:MAG: glucosamine-6-phosphate deaminase [Pirellula sp.]|nr:glucosamine-6-phosphate deaminase [Pirellula sp.]